MTSEIASESLSPKPTGTGKPNAIISGPEKEDVAHIDKVAPIFSFEPSTLLADEVAENPTEQAGFAAVEQRRSVPTVGSRHVASKWECWTYINFCKQHSGQMSVH